MEEPRRFNHDLLLEDEDRERASTRWGRLAHVLIHDALVGEFRAVELRAKRHKRLVQASGALAVALMLVALLALVERMWALEQGLPPRIASPLAEMMSAAGLFSALLASRWGPFRLRWLKRRFVAECLRLWHFRELLDGTAVERSVSSEEERARYVESRDQRFRYFLADLEGSLGSKLDRFCSSVEDGPIEPVRFKGVGDARVREELLDAIGVLRLEHQLDFAVHKVGLDDRTLFGLPALQVSAFCRWAAGLALIGALGLDASQLRWPVVSFPYLALAMLVAGVAARALRDGLALEQELAHYQETRHRLHMLRARWDPGGSDEAEDALAQRRFVIAEELEDLALQELRSFLRTHSSAQFLF